ncbi:MAG: HDIG domain-containing protein [Elusimicrobia bacterium]|nr:HDIG domain-containing protein [Candidatus Liberimonas magnetica]
MFKNSFISSFRKVLLGLLKWTEKVQDVQSVVRGKQNLWQKEIVLPKLLISTVSFIIVTGILVLGITFSPLKIIGLIFLLLMCFIFLSLYLQKDRAYLLEDSEALMLLAIVFIIAVFSMLIFKVWNLFERPMIMATPMAAFAVIIGILLSKRLAVVVSIILCVILSAINDFNLRFFFVHFFGSLAGIYSIPMIRNRGDLTKVGVRISLVNVMGIVTVWLFYNNDVINLKNFSTDISYGIASGILSVVIILATLPYLEVFFSRTTNIKLLELADFNRPLLKRLMLEAPGTYHHSLIVASLAEQAAEAIGANSLLARIGAYYHDIGKLVKPEYFIENQQTMGNPHDPLAPSMSSLVVISHVKEGVALARAADLDKVIIGCIEQHQGTSLIHYFYHRALEKNADINAENFRYPGPKPKSKETAILMLADSAEAASRALDDPSPSRLRDMVEKIINNKFTDGQFSECPITLHDLSNIAESLVLTLNGIFHARIEYQESNGSDEKKKE